MVVTGHEGLNEKLAKYIIMHVNYEYALDGCLEHAANGKILDYGCGGGDVVIEGRTRGLDIVGVEAFYGGSRARETAASRGVLDVAVFALHPDFRIPFQDNTFEMVVSNQVMEHVEDLSLTLREIARVLKPGGVLLTLFPDDSVIREGHCGIPFAHWFSNKSKPLYCYMRIMRMLGMGYHKANKTHNQWVVDFMDWLAKYTFYRSLPEIKAGFRLNGMSFSGIEHQYMGYRLGKKGVIIPESIARNAIWKAGSGYLCRRLGGLVILARKQQ